jgi:hypothetical protein
MRWQKNKLLKTQAAAWEAKIAAMRPILEERLIPEFEAWCFEHGCWLPQRLSGLTEDQAIAWLEERWGIEKVFREKIEKVGEFYADPPVVKPLTKPTERATSEQLSLVG